MNSPALYRLMTWLSPGYPVGAFAYSHGLEWVVETGVVSSQDTLGDWIEDLVVHGSGWTDAVLFSLAHDAASDSAALGDINDLAIALSPSRERQMETVALGNAFIKATGDVWPWPGLARLTGLPGDAVAYPVAVGAAAAGHGIDRKDALTAFVHGFAANLVSAGVRLIPLGQTAGQQVQRDLEKPVARTVERAAVAGHDDPGGAAMLSDIASMKHETQYTRLFRS